MYIFKQFKAILPFSILLEIDPSVWSLYRGHTLTHALTHSLTNDDFLRYPYVSGYLPSRLLVQLASSLIIQD